MKSIRIKPYEFVLGVPWFYGESEPDKFDLKYRTPWTEDELNTLRRLYPHMENEKLSEILWRSVSSIVTVAGNNGIRKSEEFTRKRRARGSFLIN